VSVILHKVKEMEKGGGEEARPHRLPPFNNPTYETSDTDNESTGTKRSKSADTTSLELKAIDYKNSDDSSCVSSSNYSTNRLSTNGDPLETLRNLAREISPGITVVPVRKESMSDPDSPFNTSFPIIVSRGNPLSSGGVRTAEKRHSKSSEESYWDLSLPTNQKRASLLFTKKSSYNDDVFDIDEILNLKPKYFGFTRKQWTTLFVFAFINIFSAIVINLQAPFYPEIAENKGATEVEIGFVFGSFEFIVFALSPIFGKYVRTNKDRNKTESLDFMLISSIFTFKPFDVTDEPIRAEESIQHWDPGHWYMLNSIRVSRTFGFPPVLQAIRIVGKVKRF